jgi:hypothetical protein
MTPVDFVRSRLRHPTARSILANSGRRGCTDRTIGTVRALAARHDHLRLLKSVAVRRLTQP